MVLGLNPELCTYVTITLTPNCHIIEVTNVSTKYHTHWIDEPRFSSLLRWRWDLFGKLPVLSSTCLDKAVDLASKAQYSPNQKANGSTWPEMKERRTDHFRSRWLLEEFQIQLIISLNCQKKIFSSNWL